MRSIEKHFAQGVLHLHLSEVMLRRHCRESCRPSPSAAPHLTGNSRKPDLRQYVCGPALLEGNADCLAGRRVDVQQFVLCQCAVQSLCREPSVKAAVGAAEEGLHTTGPERRWLVRVDCVPEGRGVLAKSPRDSPPQRAHQPKHAIDNQLRLEFRPARLVGQQEPKVFREL